MRVPYLNLTVKDNDLKSELLHAADRVLSHGRLMLGPEVEELEHRVAEYCGVKYAVGVSSGTASLYLALRALDVGPGDEVITTCFSYIATANSIFLTGSKPVFIDINEDFNIDPGKVEKAVSKRTKVIMPVHFTGKICNISEIIAIAQKHNLFIVEDASQAFGAEYNGKKSGSFGKVSCFSMNPMKILAATGEAGMVVTHDKSIYETLKTLRYNGLINKTECRYKSYNAKIDTIQAAMLLVKLKYLQNVIDSRRKIASFYNKELADMVITPKEEKDYLDIYYSYIFLCNNKDKLQLFLESNNIETKIQTPLIMPKQPAYKETTNDIFVVAENVVKKSLSIPFHENLTDEEMHYVIKKIKGFYNS
jgi:dTDP-4-amino-4,6-dideoxygalactose transaminase